MSCQKHVQLPLQKGRACRECRLKYQSDWQRNEGYRIRQYLDEVKLARGCANCGYRENVFALQWDHIVPRSNIAKKVVRWTGPKTKAEAARLVSDPNIQVLCANCHCIKTRLHGDHLPSREGVNK